MTFSHFMRSSYTRSLIILCLAYQLSACSSDSDSSGSSSVSVTWEKPEILNNKLNTKIGLKRTFKESRDLFILPPKKYC